MRTFLAILTLIFAATIAPRPAAAAYMMQEAKLIAVYFYADWCGNCKLLSRHINEAKKQGKLENKDVLFVTLDLTNQARIDKSTALAEQIGIGDYFRRRGANVVGYMALLDPNDKSEVAQLTGGDSTQTILATFKEALED